MLEEWPVNNDEVELIKNNYIVGVINFLSVSIENNSHPQGRKAFIDCACFFFFSSPVEIGRYYTGLVSGLLSKTLHRINAKSPQGRTFTFTQLPILMLNSY